ncbi:MAG TPA: hypothetical protein PKA00_15125 [Saprospiraceae bacterium]|nr:hypothetical protein [Saprospiraceae bacterium]HMQ84244.1 hypothetical protein [Saprospiraceae bacterium]
MAVPAVMTAEAIVFAINSAIKLSRNLTKAYAQSIRGKVVVLPLPDFNPNLDLLTVISFFRENSTYADEIERLAFLHKKALQQLQLPKAEWEEYQEFYHSFLEIKNGKSAGIGEKEMTHLFRIRQWEQDSIERTTVLQLVAGTIVELGIDYFLQMPGAINPESAHGKAIRHFLMAFDKIDLAENAEIKSDLSEKLVPGLFAAAAESIAALSPEIANDKKLQRFIEATAQGIANDIYKRAESADPHQQREMISWGQMLLQSTIKNAGTFVFTSSRELLDTNQPVSKIIESTGLVLLDAILDDDGEGLRFRDTLNVPLLDALTKSALAIVADHPNVLSGHQGIQTIVKQVVLAVGEENMAQKGLLGEILRIVLEKSAGQIDLLWAPGANGPEHLLAKAVQQLLQIIATEPADAVWRPALPQSQLLELTYDLLDDVVQHPDWLIAKVNQDSIFHDTVAATFKAMRKIPKSQRLQADVLRWLLRQAIATTAAQERVLVKIPFGNATEKNTILQHSLELVFAVAFPATATPQVSRVTLLIDLLDYVLDTIIRQHPDERGLVLLDLMLFESGIDFERGFDKATADQLLLAALDTLAVHPELVSNHAGLKSILSGVATAIDRAKLKQPHLAPYLLQLLLQNTGANAALLMGSESNQPRHLLSIAMEHVLLALSANDSSGRWRPELNGQQAELLLQACLDATVQNPAWVTEKVNADSLLGEVLTLTLDTFKGIPPEHRLNESTLLSLLRMNMALASSHPQVLKMVPFGNDQEKKAILRRALFLTFRCVFPEGGRSDRVYMLNDLLNYTLEVLLTQYPNEKGLVLLSLLLEHGGLNFESGFDQIKTDQLVHAALDALAAHPELVSNQEGLKNIVSGIAQAIDRAQLKQPDLGAYLLRLLLYYTGENAALLLGAQSDQPLHLLSIAMEQTLLALSAQDGNGGWRPELSPTQAQSILEACLDATVQHPKWVTEKVNSDSLLGEVLEITLETLKVIPPQHRLNTTTLNTLLRMNLALVAASPHVLQAIPFGNDAEKKAILRRALLMSFSFIFPPGSTNARVFLLEDLLEYTLATVLKSYPDKKGLVLLQLILLENNGIDFSKGFQPAQLDSLVGAALQVFGQHPDLIGKDQLMQKVVGQVAKALQNSGLNRLELLPELIRLTLEQTALHLYEVIDISEDNPEHLLVIAMEETLSAIAQTPRNKKWKPELSNSQVVEVLNIVFTSVLAHPLWVKKEPLIFILLESVFRSLEIIPARQKMPFSVLTLLIEDALHHATRQRDFLVKIKTSTGAQKKLALSYSLESFFIVIYDENSQSAAQWYLAQAPVLEALLSHYLQWVSEAPLQKENIDKSTESLRKAIAIWETDFNQSLKEILEQLEREV